MSHALRRHAPHRRRLVAGVLGVTLALLASPAWADEAVKLKIAVVHATVAAKAPDPALKNVQRSLQKAFGSKYKGFKRLDNAAFTLEKGGTSELKLPNGSAAKFTYKGTKGRDHVLQFAVPKDRLDFSLRAPLNKLFYQAGMRYGSGDDKGILILALYLRKP